MPWYNPAMGEFAEQLNLMWQLRDLDVQVYTASERAAKAARDTSSAASSEAFAKKKLEEAKTKVRDLERRERDTEIEIKALQKRLELLEESANSATSESIRKHSIEALDKERQNLDALENAGLGLLDDIEKAKGGVATCEANLKVAAEKTATLKVAQAEHQANSDAVSAKLMPGRQAMAATVQGELLQAYESARGRHPDSPICGMKDSYCEGCSGELTMHHATRVRARNEVIRCPHCARIHDTRV